MAFRGHDEKLYVENNGLFLQTREMVAEFDPVMEEYVRRCEARESQYTYLSPKIQNELIETLANEEQLSMVLRCIVDSTDSPKVEEYWIGFLKVDGTSGFGLSNEIMNLPIKVGLEIDDVRGQGYDNGS
ncbi:uncharacterized protein [Primulina huaijiensis]|uniref:uncharacterized protein n=1 Tax=Primulina huaijiensis TaxID=1492673 RepID=UPI003CC70B34